MELNQPHAAHIPPGGRTSIQNRRLWAVVGEMTRLLGKGLGEKKMREFVLEISGDDCTRKLSEPQCETVILKLNGHLKSLEAARRTPQADELPTKHQLETISHMSVDLGMNPGQLIGLTRRIIKRAWPQTRADAGKIYEALSAMLVRKISKAELKARVSKLQFLDFNQTEWERNFLEDLERRLDNNGRILPGAIKKLLEIEAKRGCKFVKGVQP